MADVCITSKEKFMELASEKISFAFIEMQTRMTHLLRRVDNTTFREIRRVCFVQTNAPNGLQLPQETITLMKDAINIEDMIDVLACTPYWSWIDLRIFEVMALASELLEAKQLLQNYKDAIFPIKLINVLPDTLKNQDKIAYCEKVVSKIEQKGDMTIGDLAKYMSLLKDVIMHIQEGNCVLANVKIGCIEIHFYITITSTDHVFHSAMINRHRFRDLNLQYIQIGNYPVINDPFYEGKQISQETASIPSSKHSVVTTVIRHILFDCMRIIVLVPFEMIFSHNGGLCNIIYKPILILVYVLSLYVINRA